MTRELGAKQKAIIFTESTITQKYLSETLLPDNGYKDKIVLFNGSNNDPKSKEIYQNWFAKIRTRTELLVQKPPICALPSSTISMMKRRS